MFIYNVTIKVDWAIDEAWVQWMLHEHIPEVINTGCFTHSHLVRLLETDDKEGPTYATQYFAENKADYNRYIENYSAAMRQKSFDKWGNRFVAFRSLMQIIQ